jgi:30S ribosomal protein 3
LQKKLVIAPPKKQRVLLRFLWLEKNIGIALDQVVPGHGTIPRKDAWEQLKTQLDSKGWISRKRTIILLNQATDIINLWQQNAANL